jgi:glycosyltransferase involved in cell wall biosynthesis
MRILFITPHIPYPLNGGERIRGYHLFKRAAEKHEVWIAGFTYDPAYIPPLAEFCQGVVAVPFVRFRHQLAQQLPGLVQYAIQGKPLEHRFKYSHELVTQLRDLHAKVHFDVIQIEESHMALYREFFPAGKHKTILALYNITALQYQRIYENEKRPFFKFRAGLYARQMERWEPEYAGQFDKCITVSTVEEKMLLDLNPKLNITTIPNGVDTQQYHVLPAAPPGNHRLIFIGNMRYAPGVDAAIYMATEILPIVRQSIPDAELWIVGREPAPEVLALASDIVHVKGDVPEVLPYYEMGAVSVVALRSGGGTRLKILEAMALGRPVVSTTIGAEGIDVEDGKHILIGDTRESFAAHTVRLLQDRDLYQHLVKNARDLVVSRYDWDALADQMNVIYDELVPQSVV